MLKDLPKLVDTGIITQETADAIQGYYENQKSGSTNWLFIVFGILGAILVGLGIILILAHNWDELSKPVKTCFAFLPLILGQLVCGYGLLKRSGSVAWRESATAFLFFAIGACIALVSQIYNIPGGTGTFILTWMLLSLPLVYIMKSSITSLLYISGITYYAVYLGYGFFSAGIPWNYWLLLLAILPYYCLLYIKKPQSNFTFFHHWILPLSVVIVLGTLTKTSDELMFMAYVSLFGLYYMLGDSSSFNHEKTWVNGYKVIGTLGTLFLLLLLSFNWFWKDLRNKEFNTDVVIRSPELYAAIILSVIAGFLLIKKYRAKPAQDIKPLAFVFLFFIMTFILGLFVSGAAVLINFYVFIIGIFTIRAGASKDHLGILNFGLLIITALVICRFFDTDLSFVIRGVLFLIVGTGFFLTNYWTLKKRKANED